MNTTVITKVLLVISLLATSNLSLYSEAKPTDRNDFLLGLAYASMVEKKNKVIKNHPQQEKVMEILARLLDHTPSQYLFTVQIIEAPVANAFALPGGFLFITDKLLKLDLNDDELAFLLGHEICHVLRHHHDLRNKEVSKVSIVNLLTMIGAIALAKQGYKDDHRRRQQVGPLEGTTGPPVIRPDHHNLPDLYAPILLGNVFGTLYLLHAFREHELDADHHGAKLAMAAGYSLDKGVGIFEKLFFSNYRNVKYEKWTTHPLTNERVHSLKADLKNVKQGQFKSDFYITQFRKDYANAYLSTYNKLIIWDSPRLLRQNNIRLSQIRKLLLQRASALSHDQDVKRRSIRYEIDHYLAKNIKKTSFALAEYGVYEQKLNELKSLGGYVDKSEEDNIKHRASQSLRKHKASIKKATPGYRQLEFLLKNFPRDQDAPTWKYQRWLKEPDMEKKTNQVKSIVSKTSPFYKDFIIELEKLYQREDKNPLYLKRIALALEKPIPAKRMKKLLKQCKNLETLAKYQHEFPNDAHSSDLIATKSRLADIIYKSGKLAIVGGQKQEAIEHFHKILLYHRGSDIEADAKEQIHKLNTLPSK